MKKLIVILVATLLAYSPASGIDVPYLTGRVTDNAEILSAETIRTLNDLFKAHEDSTTNQVCVLTIPTLDGESIEDYAYRVFNEWKLGQKEKDNGILIVVVPNDRRMRIEVGYGLEATLTDLQAGRIIQNIMTPRFKDGDYNGGVTEGAFAVIAILSGGTLPEALAISDGDGNTEGGGFFEGGSTGLTIMERILIGAFIFGIIGLFTFLGIVTPGFGWFLYFFLIPFWAMFPIVVFGTKGAFICFVSYMVLYPTAKLILGRTKWYKKAKSDLKSKGSASIGGFSFSSGSSGGSWSSGGSSFSGGGGSSGGGGASGGW